jgi:hypothetical protein
MLPIVTELPDREITPILERSHPRKPPLMLINIPVPIAKQGDFTDTFMSLDYILASETNGRAGIKTEFRDETMELDNHENTLFTSPTLSPSSLHHSGAIKLPDTTLPPLPSSPLLTPYSTSLRLPPLEDLPSTFSRRVHPAKLTRKRDREREKEEREKKVRAREKEKEGKEDVKEKEKRDGKEVAKTGWLPLEISRWGAQFRANPAHKMTKKSGNAMTTRMWTVSGVYAAHPRASWNVCAVQCECLC